MCLPEIQLSNCLDRTLSWGGARQDVEQLQERATRITGTQMDGLLDGNSTRGESQSSLQNAFLVLPSRCALCNLNRHLQGSFLGNAR